MSDDRTALHRLDQIAKVLDTTRQELIASLEYPTWPDEAATHGLRHQARAGELIGCAQTIADPHMKELRMKVARAVDAD